MLTATVSWWPFRCVNFTLHERTWQISWPERPSGRKLQIKRVDWKFLAKRVINFCKFSRSDNQRHQAIMRVAFWLVCWKQCCQTFVYHSTINTNRINMNSASQKWRIKCSRKQWPRFLMKVNANLLFGVFKCEKVL